MIDLMYIKALLFGLVEGITEFLPISSTGHMILLDQFISLSQNKAFTNSFEIIIQLGAILSVIVYYWKVINPFQKNKDIQKEKISLWMKIIIAFIPSAIMGFLLDDWLEQMFFNTTVVTITLIFYGVVLILMETYFKKNPRKQEISIQDITIKFALGIGLFQCLAMIPGTSRSAVTIIGGLLLGLNRVNATEFSFFLAIPTMVAATGWKLLKESHGFSSQEWFTLGIGFVTSFFIAYLSIKFLMKYIRTHDFKVFGYYRIILAIIILCLLKY